MTHNDIWEKAVSNITELFNDSEKKYVTIRQLSELTQLPIEQITQAIPFYINCHNERIVLNYRLYMFLKYTDSDYWVYNSSLKLTDKEIFYNVNYYKMIRGIHKAFYVYQIFYKSKRVFVCWDTNPQIGFDKCHAEYIKLRGDSVTTRNRENLTRNLKVTYGECLELKNGVVLPSLLNKVIELNKLFWLSEQKRNAKRNPKTV